MTQYRLDDEFVRIMDSYFLRVNAFFIEVKRMDPFKDNSELFLRN